MTKLYGIQPADATRVIDAVREATTLDDLLVVEAAIVNCESTFGRRMVVRNQIDAAINIRLGQLAAVAS